SELRTHFAALQHAERALHQRHRLRQIQRNALVVLLRLLLLRRSIFPVFELGAVLPLFLPLGAVLPLLSFVTLAAIARPVVDHAFVGYELVTVLLQNRAGKRPSADHEDALIVLL